MSRESWLDSESSRWVDDGLISAEARRAILSRYQKSESDPSNTFRTLAVVTAGVGVVLFVAWHWQDLPWYVKGGLTKLLTIALFLGAAWSVDRQPPRVTERWLLAAVLASYAFFGAIAEISLWDSASSIVLLCVLSAAVTAALSGSMLVTALAAATTAWWLLQAGGGPIPWPFLIVFPLIAYAAQRSHHRVLAVLTAIVFAAWAFFMALNTWEGGPLSMMMLLVAGAALEQWGRRPAERRPVFAHAATGTAVSIIGLTAALLMSVHASDSRTPISLFNTHAGQSPWPALVLAAALGLIGFGDPRNALQRPRIVSITALVWFNASLALRADLFGAWVWVGAFSALLLIIGASLVREAATTRDRTRLGLGLAAVIALVVVHFSSGKPLEGAIVLLLAGAVLYLAGRAKSPERAA